MSAGHRRWSACGSNGCLPPSPPRPWRAQAQPVTGRTPPGPLSHARHPLRAMAPDGRPAAQRATGARGMVCHRRGAGARGGGGRARAGGAGRVRGAGRLRGEGVRGRGRAGGRGGGAGGKVWGARQRRKGWEERWGWGCCEAGGPGTCLPVGPGPPGGRARLPSLPSFPFPALLSSFTSSARLAHTHTHTQTHPHTERERGEREREIHRSSHTGRMQVLPGHPLAQPRSR